MTSPAQLAPVIQATHLHEHQRTAVDRAVGVLRAMPRTQIRMACGTGKTLVGYHLATQPGIETVLLLTPTLALTSQSIRVWRQQGYDAPILAVCSEGSVADDIAMTEVEEVAPVTTEPLAIAAFVNRPGLRLVVSTYQSSMRVAAALAQLPGKRFDLAIMDEAHRTAGSRLRAFATVLADELIPCRRRVFLTATPRVVRAAGADDLDILSMDDDARYGPVAYELSFGEALKRDLLSDYRVVAIGITDAMVRKVVNERQVLTADGRTQIDAPTLAAAIGVLKAIRVHGLRRVITFHGGVRSAQTFAAALPAAVDSLSAAERPETVITAQAVHGRMPGIQRDHWLARLRDPEPGECVVLSNARCLTEGVDIPALDGVAFIDPRRSAVDVVQAVGRAMRRQPGKSAGTIILPLFLPDGSDGSVDEPPLAFDALWEVLRALRSHDESLGYALDLARSQWSAGATPTLPEQIEVDAPFALSDSFIRALRVWTLQGCTSRWLDGLGRLAAYYRDHGDSGFVVGYADPDGFPLGTWAAGRRQERRFKTLSPERERQIMEAAPDFAWDPIEDRWTRGLARFAAFVEEHGHPWVSEVSSVPEERRLRSWLKAQHAARRQGRLTPGHAAALTAVHPRWWVGPDDARFQEGLAHLHDFYTTHGHGAVRTFYVAPDGFNLGSWCKIRRGARKDGQTTDDQIAAIEGAAPGFSWGLSETRIDTALQAMEAFLAREGHVRIPAQHSEAGFPLGAWVTHIRRRRQRGLADDQLVTAVERSAPGFRWDTREDPFAASLQHLRAYWLAHEGRIPPVGRRSPDGADLHDWATRMRGRQRIGRLAPDQVAAVEAALPGWTWLAPGPRRTRSALFEAGLAALRHHVAEYGHSEVSTGYRDPSSGFALDTWVARRRVEHARGRLSVEHRHALLAVDPHFRFTPRIRRQKVSTDERFARGLAHLRDHITERGTSDAMDSTLRAPDGFRLAAWCRQLRLKAVQGTLSAADRARVLAIDPSFRWSPAAPPEMTTRERGFAAGIAHLAAWLTTEGHARMPAGYRSPDGFPLHQWVHSQRGAALSGRLSAGRRAQFEAVLPGFLDSPRHRGAHAAPTGGQ